MPPTLDPENPQPEGSPKYRSRLPPYPKTCSKPAEICHFSTPHGPRAQDVERRPEGETSKALKVDAYEALKADGVRLGLLSHADGEGRRIFAQCFIAYILFCVLLHPETHTDLDVRAT